LNAALADLEAIWTESIINELEIEKSDFKSYNAVLVVPDLFDHGYLCDLVTMMLRYMEFRGIIITQESTCATYGAGVSSAVVVDIGAQRTTIACIEDGVCQTDSRMSIGLGGDDITKTFASFLLANKFPYQEIDLNTTFDWRLAELLKEKWCTMNEADISVQVYDFFARTPFKPTLKYQCKVYDEVFLAPLCLVYPDILKQKNKKYAWLNKNVTDDTIEDLNNVSFIITKKSLILTYCD
jgi:actin-related protein 8